MDSLRYWVTEMRVDGFRFDLAPALGRETGSFDPSAAFFDAVHQDPVLSTREADRRAVGSRRARLTRSAAFPPAGRSGTRATATACGATGAAIAGLLPELATRVAGSSDLYQGAGRQPTASINFVTCHDGFTLRDLVSYARKHNEANGEHNHDGESNNLSTNFGVEGPTRRMRPSRPRACAWCATSWRRSFVSQGVPMILRRRRDGPHAARQQQRLLPGQRDQLGELDADAGRAPAPRVHAQR